MTKSKTEEFAHARRLFPHTKQVIYFNAASYGPLCVNVQQAVSENIEKRIAADDPDAHDQFAPASQLRKDFAGMIGAKKSQIGIAMSTSFGLNIAAFGLPFKRGDEILVSDVEFPAVVYTWRAAAERRGLKLKFVKSRDRMFDIAAFEKAITRRSRVLSISWVQFFNGFKNDLAELSRICKKHGMLLIVDGIQGMGVEPVDVRKLGIDIFTSGCQKWMLSPMGCGFFYLSDDMMDRLETPFMSWLGVDWKMKFTDLLHYDRPYFETAERFELGYCDVFNLVGMRAVNQIFKGLGIKNIQRHNYELIDQLSEYINNSPVYRITSSEEKKHRSSIMTFTCQRYQDLHKFLVRQKIMLVPREGSIRVAVHLYNNQQDIKKLIDCLDRFAARR
ncbi:MAG: aminotransferase class V-fold PLP-dependent enzyme [candidate division Zixibacteria bacterium]